MALQLSLLELEKSFPPGFQFLPGFITPDEERELMDHIRGLNFRSFEMYGVEAKRKIVQFGMRYDFSTRTAVRMGPSPSWLEGLKARCEKVLEKEISQVLVTHYPPSSSIGWHLDAPPFGSLMGISLLDDCRFFLRKGSVKNWEKLELTLEPRSAYVISGESRTEWEHHIPPVKRPRYSITFRTLRDQV